MKKYIALLALSVLAIPSFAEAPVVDESDSYTRTRLAKSFQQGENYDIEEAKAKTDVTVGEKDIKAPQTESDKMQLLLSKIEQMQEEIQSLRGQVEVQSHQVAKLSVSKQPQLPEPEIKPTTEPLNVAKATSNTVPKIQPKKDPVDEQLSYVGAFELVKNRQYDKAIPAMQSFLKTYPSGPYAANAHYWLGELYLLKRDLAGAVKEFKTVVDDFSDSNKLAAAKLKLGVTYIRLGETDKARTELQHVTEQFPNTSAARLARAKLEDMS